MRITFHGAAQNVTGSKHLIETGEGFKVLLDCGFHQGHRKEAEKLNRNFPLNAGDVDAVVLSHAHLDHCGLLPLLVKEGYQGPIYATPATIDVAHHMLEDSADIQEHDAEYVNRHLDPGEEPIEPLYTMEDCKKAMGQFKPIPYVSKIKDWTDIGGGVRVKMYDAGHILGSAVVVLEITEGGKKKVLAFTGDLGKKNTPILRDPQHVQEPVDILLTESTYGDRIHEPIEDATRTIREVIEHAVKHKGKVIVPAFALGRTQELIYLLHKIFHTKGFPRIPVFLDSPLAIEVTEVFKKHREVFDDQTWEDFHPVDDLPLMFEDMQYTRKRDESIRLNTMDGPMIIISASGMMEAGRVLHHLKNNIHNQNNTVLITGYQAQNTLGRRIQEGVTPVRIFNRKYDVRAKVITVPSLSAHADQPELLEYAATMQGLKKIFLVHGEAEAMETLAGLLKEQRDYEVHIPERGEQFEV